jgi:hypothetical protein
MCQIDVKKRRTLKRFSYLILTSDVEVDSEVLHQQVVELLSMS